MKRVVITLIIEFVVMQMMLSQTDFSQKRTADTAGLNSMEEQYRPVIAKALSEKNWTDAGLIYGKLAFMYVQKGDTGRTTVLIDSVFKYGRLSADRNLINLGFSLKSTVLTLEQKYKEALEIESEINMEIDPGHKVASRIGNRVKFDLHYLNKNYDSAVAYMSKIDKIDSTLSHSDSLALYNYMETLGCMDVETANKVAAERIFNISALKQQQSEREKKVLRQRIYFILIIGTLIIATLLLLYARQRQKNRALKIAHYAKEKEEEFLTLQKEAELRFTRKFIDGLEAERGRLAKELHDGVCNNLLALEMNLKTLPGKEKYLDEPLSLLTEIRMDIRSVSHELMPPAFQYATIDEMLSDYTSHIDLPAYSTVRYFSTEDVDWSLIPEQVGYEIYRIVQEALNNSIRHSSASLIEVSLLYKKTFIEIIITDNGKGFDLLKKNKGIGLRTIAGRVESIGGELIMESGGEGTKISVTVKIDCDERR